MPVENARSPAPLTTATRNAASAANASHTRPSSAHISSFMALSFSGRFKVMNAMPSLLTSST